MRWLETGPFRHKCMEAGAQRQLSHLKNACRQLIAEGGAHYDGTDVNAATIWAVLLGLRPDGEVPFDPEGLETFTVTSQVQAPLPLSDDQRAGATGETDVEVLERDDNDESDGEIFT